VTGIVITRRCLRTNSEEKRVWRNGIRGCYRIPCFCQANAIVRKETCMPFTLAQPAAAIPLSRVLGRASVLSALIIGSMSPDLVYFLPLGINRATSHSLVGLFWLCVPLGLVSYVLFHVLWRPLGSYLLPRPLRECSHHSVRFCGRCVAIGSLPIRCCSTGVPSLVSRCLLTGAGSGSARPVRIVSPTAGSLQQRYAHPLCSCSSPLQRLAVSSRASSRWAMPPV
jgi:hypothetical protein